MASRAYFKGDFMGFTFDGKHSSDMGIVRTSDGSRYNSELLPSFNDVTVAVPGGDGTYYFGSYYQQKVFSVPFATDELTESEFRELRKWFGDKGIHQLIFDEAPYKAYSAKIAAVPNFNYICFDEVAPMERSAGVQRIYKGEGTIQFVCYYPFARSVNKYLSEYDGYDTFRYFLTSDTEKQDGKTYYIKNEDEEYVEFTGQAFVEGQKYYERKRVPFEWAAASGMLHTGETRSGSGEYLDRVYSRGSGENNVIFVRNQGDLDTDFLLYCQATSQSPFTIHFYQNGVGELTNYKMTFKDIPEGTYFRINSKANLVEVTDENGNPTGGLLNKYITAGNFFKIPANSSTYFYFSTGNNIMKNIEYDYLYY